MSKLNPPLFLALDVDSRERALDLAETLRGTVGGFKVGPRLTYRYGADLVQELSKFGKVFVDNKYYDIPSTVNAALRATFDAGASFATIHASMGESALREIADLEKELNAIRPFTVLAVTVLTSYAEGQLPKNWKSSHIAEHVSALAHEVIAAGLTGIVCSPNEVEHLRSRFPHAYLVTPGIRLPTDAKGDQARVLGPAEALQLGASALVIGRPILDASDPLAAAKKFSALTREVRQ